MSDAAQTLNELDAPTVEQKFRPSALAQSLRIGPTKRTKDDIARTAKRAGVVLRRGMREDEYRRVEMRLNENDLTTMPIIIGQGSKGPAVPDAPLCGLIVTGSEAVVHPEARESLSSIVRDAAERKVPILAMSDAVPLVLEAIGREAPRGRCNAILVGKTTVTGLTTRREIDTAIDDMAASRPR